MTSLRIRSFFFSIVFAVLSIVLLVMVIIAVQIFIKVSSYGSEILRVATYGIVFDYTEISQVQVC